MFTRTNRLGKFGQRVSGFEWLEPRNMLAGNHLPTGAFDGVTSDFYAVGWALDRDAPAQSIKVRVTIDGEFVGETVASNPRPDVNTIIGVPGQHGYAFKIPPKFLDGAEHKIVVRGIDPVDGKTSVLGPSPKFFKNQLATGWLDGVTPTRYAVGWTLDRDVPNQSIDVHFYIDGAFAGSVRASDPRPDVNTALNVPGDHGFAWRIPDKYFDNKQHTIQAYAIDPANGTNPLLGSKQFNVNTLPFGWVDSIDENFVARGWAGDANAPGESLAVHFYIDGQFAGSTLANEDRSDVNPSQGLTGRHGFSWDIPAKYLDGARHKLQVFAIDPAAGRPSAELSGSSKFFKNQLAVGALDGVTSSRFAVGWALDRDVAGQPIDVHFYIDGQFAGSARASDPRPDVNQVLNVPGNHGYAWRIPDSYFDARPHTIRAYAIDPAGASNPLIGSYQFRSDGVPELHSNPGAPVTLYLDFDGHFESIWGGFRNVSTPAFDLDGNPASFSSLEQRYIRDVWEIVAEDYAPFNINVTTVDPGNFANGVGLRISIGGNGSWLGDIAGGVGYIDAFTNYIVNTAYVFSDNLGRSAKAIGEASSHEAGHSFGLNHQSTYDANGRKKDEYNPGNAQWAPIMGVSYYAARTTWHSGPSAISATTLQADLSVLAKAANRFGWRPDDHGDSAASATNLGDAQDLLSAVGLIGSPSDVDYFSFSTAGGPFSIGVTVPQMIGNLDAVLELRSASGQLLATAAPANDFGATITTTLAAGTYGLVVRSSGQYGSLGQYRLGRPTSALAASIQMPPANLPGLVDLVMPASPDFNGDGVVGGDDLPIWRSNFGQSGGAAPRPGDADGDNDVDGADFLAWQRALGSRVQQAAPLSAPDMTEVAAEVSAEVVNDVAEELTPASVPPENVAAGWPRSWFLAELNTLDAADSQPLTIDVGRRTREPAQTGIANSLSLASSMGRPDQDSLRSNTDDANIGVRASAIDAAFGLGGPSCSPFAELAVGMLGPTGDRFA